MFDDFYLNVELIHEDAKVPTRANINDVGFDIYTPQEVMIKPMIEIGYGYNNDSVIFNNYNSILISTGIKVEFPKGYCLKIVEKSGRSAKDQLIIGACIIDPDYRGEIKVNLFNLGNESIIIEKGEKIAQMIVIPVWTGKINVVKKVNEKTDRGEGGFGSTGLK